MRLLKMMRRALFLLVFILLGLPFPCGCVGQTAVPDIRVSNYRQFIAVYFAPSFHARAIILRTFELNGQGYYLVVDPENLRTAIEPAPGQPPVELSLESVKSKMKNSPYIKAIEDAESSALPLQDAGLTHFRPSQSGIDLTVDLCPSEHPLDRDLFSAVFNAFGEEERPVPVAIAITGVWMDRHDGDLQWLVDLEHKKEISITWINHSYHHRANRDLPLKENFLLEKGTDIQEEVLQTEARMIEKGLRPSVFFRFPGLISDNKLFRQITSFGLIPVGSDAWLGKNEWPKPGSIVLVHANGNERIGIQRFLKLIKEERENILNKHWLLFDLSKSVVEMEKRP